ncbi:MAG: YcxB family protein [Proteocatella sp.]
MGENSIFTIQTKMEKEDYRKFLYIAAFRRNPHAVHMLVIMSMVASVLTSMWTKTLDIVSVATLWIIMLATAVFMICLKIERKNKAMIATDKTGTFGGVNILHFYQNHMIMETPDIKGTSTLEYSKFYKVLESKDYFIFYFNANMASLIRKKDVEDLEMVSGFIKNVFGEKYRAIK